MFIGVSFVYLSLEKLHTRFFPLFLGPVFLSCSKTCVVVFFKPFSTGVCYQSKWQLFCSSCLHSDSFWVRLGEEVERLLGKKDVFLLLKYMLMVL